MTRDARRTADIISVFVLSSEKLFASRDGCHEQTHQRDDHDASESGESPSITMHTDLAKDVPRVKDDRVQLQQVLMNLSLMRRRSVKHQVAVAGGRPNSGRNQQYRPGAAHRK